MLLPAITDANAPTGPPPVKKGSSTTTAPTGPWWNDRSAGPCRREPTTAIPRSGKEPCLVAATRCRTEPSPTAETGSHRPKRGMGPGTGHRAGTRSAPDQNLIDGPLHEGHSALQNSQPEIPKGQKRDSQRAAHASKKRRTKKSAHHNCPLFSTLLGCQSTNASDASLWLDGVAPMVDAALTGKPSKNSSRYPESLGRRDSGSPCGGGNRKSKSSPSPAPPLDKVEVNNTCGEHVKSKTANRPLALVCQVPGAGLLEGALR